LYTLLPIQNNFPHENKEGLSLSPIFSAYEGKKGKNNPETDAISWSKKSLKILLDKSHEEEDVEDGKWTLGYYKFLPCPN
jgi:hypothetical protein